jgi:uncharacterized protein (DUF4415 family)
MNTNKLINYQSFTGYVREHLDEFEHQINIGIRYEKMHQECLERGFAVSLDTFRSTLYKARLKRDGVASRRKSAVVARKEEGTNEVAKEMAKEIAKELSKELAKEIAKEIAKEVAKELAKGLAKENSKEETKEKVPGKVVDYFKRESVFSSSKKGSQ